MRHTMGRRVLIAAVFPTAIALAACGTITDDKINKVSSDVALIANGLKGTLTQLAALNVPQLTPAIMDTVSEAVGYLEGTATAIAGVTTAAAAQPLVQKIETYVNTIVTALAAIPLPPPISTALQAAAILLPIIEVAVGLAIDTPAPMARLKAASTMTPDQARLVLDGMAATAFRSGRH